MGLSVNWIALQGGDKTAVLERLGLEECGAASDEISSGYACTTLPGGWFLIASGQMKLKLEAMLPALTAEGFGLGGEVEERAMFSRLVAYRDGQQAWAVVHDPDKDPDDVAVDGEPPALLDDVRREIAKEQADFEFGEADFMFEAPTRLGSKLAGYEPGSPAAVEWRVLEPVERRRAPRPAPRLAPLMRAELVPWLAALGWSPAGRGAEFEFERLRNGDREILRLGWWDEPARLDVGVMFMVLDGAAPDAEGKVSGDVRAAPVSLWRGLAGRLRKPPPYEARIAAVLAAAREDVQVVERFLATGAGDPRLFTYRRRPPSEPTQAS